MAKTDTKSKALVVAKEKMKVAQQDAKTIGGILDRWAKEAEEFVGDIFQWGKKHKALVISVGLLAWGIHWLLSSPERKEEKEEEEF